MLPPPTSAYRGQLQAHGSTLLAFDAVSAARGDEQLGDPVTSIQMAVVEADPLRAERLTRSLKRALDAVDGITVDYATAPTANSERAKGGVVHDVLEASIMGVWPVAAPLLAEVVKSWLHREEGSRVRISVGWDHVEIEGEPTPEQEKLLLALLERREEK
jgi:hypothetical protein